jgi:hypothetical protein
MNKCLICNQPARHYLRSVNAWYCNKDYEEVMRELNKHMNAIERRSPSSTIIAVSKRYSSIWFGFYLESSRHFIVLRDAVHIRRNRRRLHVEIKKIPEVKILKENFLLMQR